MKNEINAVLENMTAATPEPEDYTGEDGLLYCGKCRKPKEAYFAPDKAAIFGRDRHPAECDCQRAAREEREAAEKRRRHLDTVEELKRRGFTDPTMRDWTFENDNGRNPQAGIARRYVEHWEDMRADNIGCLFWGGVGTGKSYLAGCIANALMEKEIPVHMTNFALILNDLAASFEGRNEYISRLCRYPLLIIDDFGMERGTDYGLEQVFHVIDTRYPPVQLCAAGYGDGRKIPSGTFQRGLSDCQQIILDKGKNTGRFIRIKFADWKEAILSELLVKGTVL